MAITNGDNVFRVSPRIRVGGHTTTFSLYYRISGSWNPLTVTKVIAASWTADMLSLWLGVLSQQTQYLGILVDKPYGSDALKYDFPVTVALGAVVGEALPSSCAVQIMERTADFGPRSQGRIYLAGIPESASTFGRFSNAATPAAWSAILAALVDPWVIQIAGVNTTLQPVSKSSKASFGGTVMEPRFSEVTGSQYATKIAVLNRRDEEYPAFIVDGQEHPGS